MIEYTLQFRQENGKIAAVFFAVHDKKIIKIADRLFEGFELQHLMKNVLKELSLQH